MIRVYIPKRIDSIKSEIIEASLRLRDAGMVEVVTDSREMGKKRDKLRLCMRPSA